MIVGIIGGGITGLTAAYELMKKGHKPIVIEQDVQLGGQAGTFATEGDPLERFYHHLFKTDLDIVGLIRELGLDSKLSWLESRTGYFHGGTIYPFVSPIDLMRFKPLSLSDRIRLGLMYLRLQRDKDWQSKESLTAKEWIVRHGSQKIYDVFWGPLLRGKFAESAEEVSMTWLWGKIFLRGASRTRAMTREQLGYLDGSFQVLIDALADKIRAGSGEILTTTRVDRIEIDNAQVKGLEVRSSIGGSSSAWNSPSRISCDRVIATVSSPAFLSIAPELPGDYADKLRRVRYQTAVCVVLQMSQPLSQTYWTNIGDRSIPFVGVIEHTNFVPASKYGGAHIAYLTNYISPAHPLFRATDGQILEEYLPHLKKINPRFDQSWIRRFHVFRDNGGQPIVTTNYSGLVPDHRTPIDGLYLANTTQIYPEDRGTNYSVRLGQKIAGIVGG